MYCTICLMQIVLFMESIFVHYSVYLLGYFGILESTGVVEKVEVEVEMKEYKYEELAKALENFGNKYYIFLFFVCLSNSLIEFNYILIYVIQTNTTLFKWFISRTVVAHIF